MTAGAPDHPITCAKEPGRVQVLFEGHSIATSDDVLLLSEAGYAPVRYFPREHVAMAFLKKTEKTTRCPYKGEASYYTILRDRRIVENAVWSYENPTPGMGRIAGRLAFYPGHFDFQVDDADEGARSFAPARESGDRAIDETIKHTDSGSGSSQAEHWPPNVSMPDDEAWEGEEPREASPAKDGSAVVARPYDGTGSI